MITKPPISLDVALSVIGELRMRKIDEVSKENNFDRKQKLKDELEVLTVEERIAQGLQIFEDSDIVRKSILEKIEKYYAPILKSEYEKRRS